MLQLFLLSVYYGGGPGWWPVRSGLTGCAHLGVVPHTTWKPGVGFWGFPLARWLPTPDFGTCCRRRCDAVFLSATFPVSIMPWSCNVTTAWISSLRFRAYRPARRPWHCYGGVRPLRRGLPVIGHRWPYLRPRRPATLGRMFNVLGHPIDGGGSVTAELHPIHVQSPPITARSWSQQAFVTGNKAIDLLTPIPEAARSASWRCRCGKMLLMIELMSQHHPPALRDRPVCRGGGAQPRGE